MPDETDYLLKKHRRPEPPTEAELAEMVRAAEESGQLRHLYGRPLDLSDDSPDWFIKRALKQEGFTHPALERTRELDAERRRAEEIVEALRRRRDSLSGQARPPSALRIHDFNGSREHELHRYRDLLRRHNRSIRDFNITVPTALQRPYLPVDRILDEVERDIPPLELPAAETAPRRRSWLSSLFERRRPS